MVHRIVIYLKNFDWVLFASVLLLIFFGLVEIYSIALSQENQDFLNFNKQLIFTLAGLVVLFIFAFLDYFNWRSFSRYIYIFGLVLLIGVLIFGETIRGTRGWFYLGPLSIQPVEFIKFVLIIFLARYFSDVSIKLNPAKHLLISGVGVLVFIILVLLQPDFGSAVILFLLWVAMLVVAGFKLKYLAVVGLIVIMVMGSGWAFFFAPYQKQRLVTYLNPSFDPLDQSYNITQAIIAIGAGGLVGRGVGFGSQSQLKFLPEAQNDFIFAVIAEELGFLGTGLILLFFAILLYRLLKSLKAINNDFGIFFIIGGLALIFIEMFINIGMNIGLLPVIGISLPFVSYGGSAMITSLMLIGVAESIIIRSKLKY